MASVTNRPIRICVRLLLTLIGAAGLCGPVPVGATALRINESMCHVVSDFDVSDGEVETLRFTCVGSPTYYQQRSLWLRADWRQMGIARGSMALMVHKSRFDRLAVAFAYADGAVRWQQVHQGDYGLHWRTGDRLCLRRLSVPRRSSR